METDKPRNKGGRPEGSANRMARESREAAQKTGKLPHEILLDIARGKPVVVPQVNKDGEPIIDERGIMQVKWLVPETLDDIRGAATAAAPYFAPKITAVEVLAGASEDELDRIIAQFAAEAGVSLSTGNEGQARETPRGAGTSGDGSSPPQRPGTGVGTTILRQRPVTGT